MENCGLLIKQERERRNISQAQLVELCQFTSNSTISRIESNKTTPSLSIVVRIFSILNIKPGYIFEKLTGYSITSDLNSPDKTSPKATKTDQRDFIDYVFETTIYQPIHLQEILSISDLLLFKRKTETHLHNSVKILAEWINFSFETIIKNLPQNPNRLMVNSYPECTPDTIKNFYLPNPIFTHEIKYPPLPNKTIYDILRNDGGIMPTDSAQYIKNLRLQKNETIQDITVKLGIAHLTLQKIEQGQNARLNIYDVVRLDSLLNASGIVFNLLWNAEEFIINFGFPQKEFWDDYQIYEDRSMHLIKTFVTLSRWWYTIPGRDTTWLNNLKVNLNIVQKK